MKISAAWIVCVTVSVGGAARAAVPAWCSGTKGERVDFNGLEHALSGDSVFDSVHDLVGALCKPDEDAKAKHAELEAQRKAWSEKLGMNDADWADAAEWSAAMASMRGNTSLGRQDKKRWSAMSPVDQFALLGNDIGQNYDAAYMADAFADKLSESGRAAYLDHCLGSNEHEVTWAMCQGDADAYDFKKLAAEVSADKAQSGFDRFLVRLNGYRLKEKLAEHAAKVKAAKASDPAYGKMFEVAEATRKTWTGLWRTDAALLDLALTMDDARAIESRKAFEGCDEKTWAAWKAAIGGIPAKRFAAVQPDEYRVHYLTDLVAVVGTDPKGYLAASAMYTCGAGGKRDPLLRYIGEAFQRWSGYRGPRTATMTAILGAGLELDDRSAKIDYPSVDREWFERNGGSSGGGNGPLSAVKAQGDKVHFEFAAKMEKISVCLQTRRTNHLTAIRSDGTLVYQVDCLKEGTQMVNRASQPVDVKARYAVGVHAGQSVDVVEDAVIAVWSKPGVPVMIGGAPVK